MSSALAIDRSRGPQLPADFHRPDPQPKPKLKSPLPPEWSNATKPLRDLARELEKLVDKD